jgi:hypothetical protein
VSGTTLGKEGPREGLFEKIRPKWIVYPIQTPLAPPTFELLAHSRRCSTRQVAAESMVLPEIPMAD